MTPMYGVFDQDTLITQWTDSGSAEDDREARARQGYESLDVTEVCECGDEHRIDDCPEQQEIALLERILEGLRR